MNSKDIRVLLKILKYKGLTKLADLLENCQSELLATGEYGTYAFSELSTFVVFAPLEQYYELKKIDNENKKVLLECIHDIYPPGPKAPEVDYLDFRLLPDEEVETKIKVPKTTIKTLRVFLSYSSKDKKIVGVIKKYLEKYGLEVFIAHDDIKPSSEWQEVILQNLDSTDIFIPIITENFQSSPWAGQESGIAFSKEKFIIPVSINGFHPLGFLNKYQSLNFKLDDFEESCNSIIKVIKGNTRYNLALLEPLIRSLPTVGTFDQAGRKFYLLSEFQFLPDQINELVKYSIKNNQIYSSWSARPYLNGLLERYKEVIDKELKVKLEEILENG